MAKISRPIDQCEVALRDTQEALRTSEAFNRTLMDGSVDCVKVLDLDGHLLHMNAPGRCLMEIDDFGPLSGQEWSALWPAQARQDIEKSLAAARGGDPYSFQAFCPTAKGTPRWWDVIVSPIRDAADGPVVRVLSVSRDITERKQAEEVLTENEARFRRVLRQSPAGIVQTDATGCMTLVNERWCEMLGYSEAELLGKSVLDVTHSSSLTATAENVARLAEGGPDFQIEKNYCRKDGSHFPAQSNVSAVRSPTGEFLGLIAVVVDVSERLRADQELRDRAGQLDLLAHSAQRLLECHSLTPEVRQEIFGEIAELIGVGSFFHYRADNAERCLFLEASSGLSDEDRRVYGTLKYGELLCGRVAESAQRLIVEDLPRSTQPGSEPLRAAGAHSYAGFPLLDSRGELVGTLAFVSPKRTHFREGEVQMIETICAQVALMMERKRAEEALREKEHFLQRITQVTPGVLNVFDLVERRAVFINHSVESVLGYSPEEVQAMGTEVAPTLMHPEDLPRFEQHMARVRALAEGEVADFEFQMRDRAGAWHWFLSHDAVFARDATGAARQLIGVATEITARKWTEEALREQKHFLDRITAVTPDVLYVLDITDYHFKWVSQQAANRMGYSAEEILAMGADFMPRVMHPDDLARMPAHFAELARAENGQTLEIEYRLRRPDGTWRWFGGRKTPFSRDAKGNVREIIGTSSDITERKRAEEAIARLAAIVESSHDALFSEDLDGIITTWNRGAEEIFGYRAEEIIGTSILRLIPAARQAEEHETQRKLAAGERGGTVETIRRAKDGREFPVSITVSALKDAAGQVIGTSRAVRDITEWKRVEEALRQNAALFSTLIQQAPMGTYVVDAQFRVREVNAEAMPAFATVQPLVGRDLGEVMAILWGAEVGRRCADIFRHTLATGERHVSPPFTEQRHDLGIEQTYEWETQRVTFPDGQHGVVCYFHEVTERTRATAALRASQERMSLAAEATGVGIWEWNVITGFIRWDAPMFRLYGVPPTADGFVSYDTWSRAVLPEDLARQEEVLMDTVRRCGQSSREFRILRADDGECRWIHAVETVRANHEGKAEWVVGTNLDITEREQKEEALHASEERLRLFAGQLEHVVNERTEELVQSQDRLRALAMELSLAEQRERKRLAGELHDYLAQLLVLGRLNLGQIKGIGLPTNAEKKVRDTEEVLTQALHYCRTLMAELSPPVLQEHGLSAALRWLGEQMAHRGLTVRVDIGGAAEVRLPEDTGVLLFQSARELLLNALKYAECREVAVRMERADGRLRLEICDDGVGFDPDAVDLYSQTAMSSKFGLFSIRERMRSMGGWFDLKSSPGAGTTATLVLPLKTADSTELKVLSAGLSDNSALPSNSKLKTQNFTSRRRRFASCW